MDETFISIPQLARELGESVSNIIYQLGKHGIAHIQLPYGKRGQVYRLLSPENANKMRDIIKNHTKRNIRKARNEGKKNRRS